jgi:hypothetical protein
MGIKKLNHIVNLVIFMKLIYFGHIHFQNNFKLMVGQNLLILIIQKKQLC